MRFQIWHYIKFILKSTNQHGVHSPFVYDLVTKCFYDNSSFKAYLKIDQYRQALLKNRNNIDLSDLETDSPIIRTNTRRISKIEKRELISKRRTKLTYRFVKYFKCDSILELGTTLGITTQAMRLGSPNGHITTIEVNLNMAEFTRTHLKQQSLGNIDILQGNVLQHIQKLKPNTYDLVYFNATHKKETTLKYFETLLPSIHNNTAFIFNGIYKTKEMIDAWEIIKQHPKVTVSIDTYFFGVIFFRTEQQKEHFTIRV